ncbi:hypothetical protein FRB90_005168 [Tulasnella sp. 427]|nr:hypothetical protein FRB90_005168 [Tulasnella sp. 427]
MSMNAANSSQTTLATSRQTLSAWADYQDSFTSITPPAVSQTRYNFLCAEELDEDFTSSGSLPARMKIDTSNSSSTSSTNSPTSSGYETDTGSTYTNNSATTYPSDDGVGAWEDEEREYEDFAETEARGGRASSTLSSCLGLSRSLDSLLDFTITGETFKKYFDDDATYTPSPAPTRRRSKSFTYSPRICVASPLSDVVPQSNEYVEDSCAEVQFPSLHDPEFPSLHEPSPEEAASAKAEYAAFMAKEWDNWQSYLTTGVKDGKFYPRSFAVPYEGGLNRAGMYKYGWHNAQLRLTCDATRSAFYDGKKPAGTWFRPPRPPPSSLRHEIVDDVQIQESEEKEDEDLKDAPEETVTADKPSRRLEGPKASPDGEFVESGSAVGGAVSTEITQDDLSAIPPSHLGPLEEPPLQGGDHRDTADFALDASSSDSDAGRGVVCNYSSDDTDIDNDTDTDTCFFDSSSSHIPTSEEERSSLARDAGSPMASREVAPILWLQLLAAVTLWVGWMKTTTTIHLSPLYH